MKKYILVLGTGLFLSFTSSAQININKTVNKAKKEANKVLNPTKPLSNQEVVSGLKEALTIGTNNSSASAAKLDGFNKNQLIKISFPPEAIKVKNTLEDLGMKSQVDKFVLTLNRAAEEASKDAAPIFVNAVKSMSIGDGFAVLKGADDAATSYLKDKTSTELKQKFKPVVKNAIQKVEVTKYWNPLITKYNLIPGVQKMNPDIDEYVTQKAMEGLFKLIAQEELKIRKDPVARVTDLLKKVFGGK